MAETLVERQLEKFLRETPQASRKEILEFREIVKRYFLGELSPEEFKTRRLHMGAYGIRNTKDLHMVRIKIPQGRLTAEQLEAPAELAQTCSNGVGHITTPGYAALLDFDKVLASHTRSRSSHSRVFPAGSDILSGAFRRVCPSHG